MSRKEKCPTCGGKIEAIGHHRRIFRPDPETMTDGQLAEQHAAEMGGPFEEGVHGVTTRFYECEECSEQLEVRG